MYQVIEIYGDNEPWWFFDNWQNDIVAKRDFASFEEALIYYQKKFSQLELKYADFKEKKGYLTAFWNAQEERWCEECDEFLQQFWGLALLEDYKMVTNHDSFVTNPEKETNALVKYCKISRFEEAGFTSSEA